MLVVDFFKALSVAAATLIITLLFSIPMVGFYAYFIEPGHPQEFYNDAAQWIAPWSSYVLGPICFFAFNFWLARRTPARNAMMFATSTIIFYLVIELVLLRAMNQPLGNLITVASALSLITKAAGAWLGAKLGWRRKQPEAA